MFLWLNKNNILYGSISMLNGYEFFKLFVYSFRQK